MIRDGLNGQLVKFNSISPPFYSQLQNNKYVLYYLRGTIQKCLHIQLN